MVLIAIDGRGGAGKSTIASQLRAPLKASIVAVDDFYRVMSDPIRFALGPRDGYMQYCDWQRLRSQVLTPLRHNSVARYERFDWQSRQLGAVAEVQPEGVVIVEGVASFRPELRPFYDYSIFIAAPRDLCLARLFARGHGNEEWIPHWSAAEDWYVQHHDPAAAVDIVVS